ncbi:hypothetical protein JTB14_022121 [Gonioctena quinquepunctata]|nr:hypothetical protein JTB14_022121 [Gonioctena quinquepunctata]
MSRLRSDNRQYYHLLKRQNKYTMDNLEATLELKLSRDFDERLQMQRNNVRGFANRRPNFRGRSSRGRGNYNDNRVVTHRKQMSAITEKDMLTPQRSIDVDFGETAQFQDVDGGILQLIQFYKILMILCHSFIQMLN